MGQVAAWPRYLRYLREGSYGSGVPELGTEARLIDIAGESMAHRPRREEVRPESFGSAQRVLETELRGEGNQDLLPDFVRLGHFFAHHIGDPLTTVPAAGAFSHLWYHAPLFSPWSMQHDLYRDHETHRYPGACGRMLRLATDGPRHLMITVAFLSMSERDGGAVPEVDEALLPVPIAAGPPNGYDFELELQIDGAPADSSLGSLSLEFTWGRRLRTPAQSLEPVGIISDGTVSVRGALRWFFQADTSDRHEAYRALQQFGIRATWTGALLVGSTYESLEIHLPNCWASGRGPNIRGSGGPGSMELETQFSALYDPDYGGPFRVVLVNHTEHPELLEIDPPAPPPVGVNLLLNPSCEDALVAGNIPSWTEVVGTGWTQRSSTGDVIGPKDGAWFFFAGAIADAELRQDVDVSAYAATIDAGTQQFQADAWTKSYNALPADQCRVVVEYRTAGGAVLTSWDTGLVSSVNAWVLRTDTRTAPATTRTIRFRLIVHRRSGSNCDAWFDYLFLIPL